MGRVVKALGAATGGLSALLIGMIAWSGASVAQSMSNMSILTGAEGGTYHRFGTDMRKIVKKVCAADLQVRPSQGSLDNLGRLRNEPFTQLAIVQQDVLDYVRQSEDRDPTLKEWIEKFRYVLPLYREEVHVVVRRDAGLRTLADLAGKRLVVGESGSGTHLTATLILTQAGLRGKVTEAHMTARDGILRLLDPASARVDAVFYVAGTPVPLLSGADQGITMKHLEQLSLVAIPAHHVSKRYGPAQLTRAIYPWLDRAVDTVAVRAILIAFDFKGPQCDNVAMLARLVTENLEELQERIGHEKWREVEIDAVVPGWERYACVARRLATPVEGCRFGSAAESGASPSTDCRAVCAASERKRNPLPCMLCQDKSDLNQRR